MDVTICSLAVVVITLLAATVNGERSCCDVHRCLPPVIAWCSRDGTTKKPGHAGWPGLGAAQEARGLGIPHVITGCAVASVQPCGWGGGYNNRCDDTSASCACGRAT